MSVTVETLRNRWSGRPGQALAAEVITRMIRGQVLDELPLSRHGGRFDLRYLWLVSTRLIDDPRLAARTLDLVPTLADVHVADLDLTGSTARLDIDNAEFRNCRAIFDRCLFEGTAFSGYAGGPRFVGNSFLDCIFRGRFKTTLTFGPYVPQILPPAGKPT